MKMKNSTFDTENISFALV